MNRPEQVFLAVEPVDMRWGMERLSCHVQHHLGHPPNQGSAWAFTNRPRTRLKLLVWDGTGVWLCQRRLHRGCFHWPRPGDSGSDPPAVSSLPYQEIYGFSHQKSFAFNL